MRLLRILAVSALITGPACGSGKPRAADTAGLAAMPPPTDAPYELAYDQDLKELRDRYEALGLADPARARLRRELADEHARRVRAALADPEQRHAAPEALMKLASLWTPRELAHGPADLAPYQDVAHAIRASFARSGGDLEAAAALFFLAVADPGRKAEYLAELDDIFVFADDLAVARYGDGAQHARPIEILEAALDALPTPEVVDRLLQRYAARRELLASHFRRQGLSTDLLRAHGAGVFRTAWSMVRALARAERLSEAPAALDGMAGLGDDRKLREALTGALSDDGGPESWVALASAFLDDEPEKADPMAALRISLEGSRRHPGSAALLLAAADMARGLERHEQAIALFEAGLALEPDHRDAAESLAELYRYRVSMLAFAERPQAARAQLATLEAFLAGAQERWSAQPLEADLATAYAAMGRGLAGLGQLEEAEAYLQRSLALRPTYQSLEYLGMIALKQDRFAVARDFFEQALRVPVKDIADRFERAKVLRLAGDALAGLGQMDRAVMRWSESIEAWMELVRSVELPPRFQAELLIESAKAQWALGDRETGLSALETAVDVDPDGSDTYTSVVSFLIPRGYYERALDAYHRALGSHEVGDYAKVYLSLWILAEARRRGEAPDPLARAYLAGREGQLWYDALARFATGRSDLDALAQRATTRGRLAELWYYTAVLAPPEVEQETDELLRRVLATGMVLFFEYDMAKYWLTEGVGRLRHTAP